MTPQKGMTVRLEDHGQDFLEFDIKGGKIIATRPFQGFVWNGRQVMNTTLGVGDRIWLGSESERRPLLYRVESISALAVAIGPGDI